MARLTRLCSCSASAAGVKLEQKSVLMDGRRAGRAETCDSRQRGSCVLIISWNGDRTFARWCKKIWYSSCFKTNFAHGVCCRRLMYLWTNMAATLTQATCILLRGWTRCSLGKNCNVLKRQTHLRFYFCKVEPPPRLTAVDRTIVNHMKGGQNLKATLCRISLKLNIIIHPVTTRIILIILYYAMKHLIIDATLCKFFFPLLKIAALKSFRRCS